MNHEFQALKLSSYYDIEICLLSYLVEAWVVFNTHIKLDKRSWNQLWFESSAIPPPRGKMLQ